MAERTLTWNARDFLDDDVADVPFVFSLPAGDRGRTGNLACGTGPAGDADCGDGLD